MESRDVLIDHIYEAALVPEMWPDVLDRVAALSRTAGGVLFAVSPRAISPDGRESMPFSRWTSSASVAHIFTAFMRDGWAERNTRVPRGLALGHAGFVTDADLFTPEEIDNEPLYKYFREIRIGWFTGFAVQAPTGDSLIFNWERRHSDGPVERETVAMLDPLRSHLARASLMSSRLGLDRAKMAADTLEVLGLPAAVLSDRNGLLAVNRLMESLMPGVLEERAYGRLHLCDASADQLLTQALAKASVKRTHAPGQIFSLPVPARDAKPPLVVHVIPIRRTARDIFAMAASIVIVTPVSRAEVPDASVIQGLFDLTAAEARVARAIASGESVSQIAVAGNTAEGTVRHHLKAVFAKTGAVRQGDLVSLLGSLQPHRSIKN